MRIFNKTSDLLKEDGCIHEEKDEKDEKSDPETIRYFFDNYRALNYIVPALPFFIFKDPQVAE